MKRSFLILMGCLILLVGIVTGVALTLRLTVTVGNFASAGVYSAEPPLPVPTLQTLTANAADDDAALAAIVDYFEHSEDELAVAFKETNPTRLRALYAMYISHVSHIYAPPEPYSTFLEYVNQPYSHCGSYSENEARITRALGLETRIIEISGGTHAFVEVNVDGQWEVFDSTVNVWINRAGFELERGAERQYRTFYTPLLDESAEHNSYTLSAVELRTWMMGLGIYWTPLAMLVAR